MKGKRLGRKKSIQSGGFFIYSHSQNQQSLSILNEEPINEDDEFKTLDGKRNYDLFRRIISDQNKVKSL